jgi:hypothetical protein
MSFPSGFVGSLLLLYVGWYRLRVQHRLSSLNSRCAGCCGFTHQCTLGIRFNVQPLCGLWALLFTTQNLSNLPSRFLYDALSDLICLAYLLPQLLSASGVRYITPELRCASLPNLE